MRKGDSMVVSAGNTDNKLTQQQWSDYVQELMDVIQYYCKEIHFFGGPETSSRYQNVAWIFEVDEEEFPDSVNLLVNRLVEVRRKHKQDSVMVMRSTAHLV